MMNLDEMNLRDFLIERIEKEVEGEIETSNLVKTISEFMSNVMERDLIIPMCREYAIAVHKNNDISYERIADQISRIFGIERSRSFVYHSIKQEID